MYVKKGKSNRFRDDDKNQRRFMPKNEDHMSQRPQTVIGEIRTIIGGPVTGESFISLKKACQRQVNSIYMTPLFKQRRTNQDMSFSEEDAKGVKQPHNDPLVIMLMIEGFNTKRILVDNDSSANVIYLPVF